MKIRHISWIQPIQCSGNNCLLLRYIKIINIYKRKTIRLWEIFTKYNKKYALSKENFHCLDKCVFLLWQYPESKFLKEIIFMNRFPFPSLSRQPKVNCFGKRTWTEIRSWKQIIYFRSCFLIPKQLTVDCLLRRGKEDLFMDWTFS